MAGSLDAPVTFAGPIFDEASLISRLKTSEIFVYPSIAAKGEALPLAPLEAMACGVCRDRVLPRLLYPTTSTMAERVSPSNHKNTNGDALADQLQRLMSGPTAAREPRIRGDKNRAPVHQSRGGAEVPSGLSGLDGNRVGRGPEVSTDRRAADRRDGGRKCTINASAQRKCKIIQACEGGRARKDDRSAGPHP